MTDSKKKMLDDIYHGYQKEFTGNDFVFGYGDINAAIMFIGEAPGKDEVRLGRPFVGRAGEKFSDILRDLDLCREEIYLTNAIKYALRSKSKKTGRIANRPARISEIKTSRPYLLEEILCINPKLIITLGAVPLKMLIDRYDVSILKFAGYKTKTASGEVFPLLHPAAMIYNPGLIDRFKEDTKKLKNIIGDMI